MKWLFILMSAYAPLCSANSSYQILDFAKNLNPYKEASIENFVNSILRDLVKDLPAWKAMQLKPVMPENIQQVVQQHSKEEEMKILNDALQEYDALAEANGWAIPRKASVVFSSIENPNFKAVIEKYPHLKQLPYMKFRGQVGIGDHSIFEMT